MITIIALVDICFSILIGGEAGCQKAIGGAEVFSGDILNSFFSIISFLKTNVRDIIWSPIQHFLAFYET